MASATQKLVLWREIVNFAQMQESWAHRETMQKEEEIYIPWLKLILWFSYNGTSGIKAEFIGAPIVGPKHKAI